MDALEDSPREVELFRMEKSVMTKSNFDELGMASGDRIPEALLEFICYEHQYNLFGFGVLDPVEFARKFKFSYRYLVGKHDDPYQRQLRRILKKGDGDRRGRQAADKESEPEFICENRIENALFILANYPLNITSTSVLEDKSLVRQYGFLRVLDSFTLHQDGRTGKLTYYYRLDDKFRRNLSSLYLTTRRDSLVALRRSGLGALYVFLLKLRDAVFAEGRSSTLSDNTPSFEYLCNLSGVPDGKDWKDAPKYRKKRLNAYLAKVAEETELEFRVEWVKGTGTERYTPIFHFFPPEGFTQLAPDRRYLRHLREMERINVAVHEFKHNLVAVCPFNGNRYSPEAEEFFFRWIRSEDESQTRLMAFALEQTFINIGSGIPRDIDRRIDLFRHHATHMPRKDFDKWVRDIFTSNYGFSVPPFRCIDDRKK